VRPAAVAQLAHNPLFEGLEEAELAELAALTTPWTAAAGELVFRQGDHGDRLVAVTSGRLEATVRQPSGGENLLGTVAPGEIAGELALLADGRRTASVRAVEESAGVALTREVFELLRLQLRPVALAIVRRIGEAAQRRLLARYRAIAAELAGVESSPLSNGALVGSDAQGVSSSNGDASCVRSNGLPDAYLEQILFFRRFRKAEIGALFEGLRVISAPRGAKVDPSGVLLIVLRGAVQTSLVDGAGSVRVRLSGPGRCVGHLGLVEGAHPAPKFEAVLRERALLLEVPHARAKGLLAGAGSGAQRFAEAFYDDVVRALLAAEWHLPLVVRPALPV
jgi:CRP-like cAMP-binding protein